MNEKNFLKLIDKMSKTENLNEFYAAPAKVQGEQPFVPKKTANPTKSPYHSNVAGTMDKPVPVQNFTQMVAANKHLRTQIQHEFKPLDDMITKQDMAGIQNYLKSNPKAMNLYVQYVQDRVEEEIHEDNKKINENSERSLNDIAMDIYDDWKNVSGYAKPYLNAMASLDNINDKYGLDEGRMIVAYFLSNASSWKGEKAREIKKELNQMLKNAMKKESINENSERSLNDIVMDIYDDWKNVSGYAKPYLNAMASLDNINDKYGLDEGRMIVAYFLSNASSWKGEKAREIKKELNQMLKNAMKKESINEKEKEMIDVLKRCQNTDNIIKMVKENSDKKYQIIDFVENNSEKVKKILGESKLYLLRVKLAEAIQMDKYLAKRDYVIKENIYTGKSDES